MNTQPHPTHHLTLENQDTKCVTMLEKPVYNVAEYTFLSVQFLLDLVKLCEIKNTMHLVFKCIYSLSSERIKS